MLNTLNTIPQSYKIKTISIEWIKSIQHLTFNPDPNITHIKGPNTSGKTSIMLALSLFSGTIKTTKIKSLINNKRPLNKQSTVSLLLYNKNTLKAIIGSTNTIMYQYLDEHMKPIKIYQGHNEEILQILGWKTIGDHDKISLDVKHSKKNILIDTTPRENSEMVSSLYYNADIETRINNLQQLDQSLQDHRKLIRKEQSIYSNQLTNTSKLTTSELERIKTEVDNIEQDKIELVYYKIVYKIKLASKLIEQNNTRQNIIKNIQQQQTQLNLLKDIVTIQNKLNLSKQNKEDLSILSNKLKDTITQLNNLSTADTYRKYKIMNNQLNIKSKNNNDIKIYLEEAIQKQKEINTIKRYIEIKSNNSNINNNLNNINNSYQEIKGLIDKLTNITNQRKLINDYYNTNIKHNYFMKNEEMLQKEINPKINKCIKDIQQLTQIRSYLNNIIKYKTKLHQHNQLTHKIKSHIKVCPTCNSNL